MKVYLSVCQLKCQPILTSVINKDSTFIRDLRIAVLGNTGLGKSSTANTILGRKWFRVNFSPLAVTQTCERKKGEVNGKTTLVIDTPGLFNTSLTEEKLKAEMKNLTSMSDPGLHAFLLVIKLGVRFTVKERNIMQWIQSHFGEDAARYTIILFTHADQLNGEPLEEYIIESLDLMSLIHSCGDRYHLFNNNDIENRDQVTQLLEKIDEMVETNKGHHSTLEKFKEAQTHNKLMEVLGALKVFFGLVVFVAVVALKQLQQQKNG